MREAFKESIRDESGKVSGPRLQAVLCTVFSIAFASVGLVLIVLKVAGVSSYVISIVGIFMGKAGSDIWAAQNKSKAVKTAETQTKTTTTTQTETKTTETETKPKESRRKRMLREKREKEAAKNQSSSPFGQKAGASE